jgi:signal peptidase II
LKALYISLAVVIVDQVTKLIVKGFSIPFLHINFDGMYLGQVIPVFGDFFRITFVENPGMAFGYDPGNSFKLIISIFSLFASLALVFYLYTIRNRTWSLRIAIAMILGGAVGNLIDRTFYGIIYKYAPVFYGRVVDFFDFDFFNFTLFGRSYDRWPVFNIADASVTIGVLILVLFYKKHQEQDSAEKKVELVGETANNSNPTVELNPVQGVNSDSEVNDNDIPEKLENEQSDKPKEVSN